MRFLGYPIYKILFALVVGVLLQRYIAISLNITLTVCTISLLVLIACLVIKIKYEIKNAAFFIAVIFFFGSFAIINTILRKPQFLPNHFVHTSYEDAQIVELQLLNELAPNSYSQRFYARVLQIGTKQSTGKVLFQTPLTDSLNLIAGNEILLATNIVSIAVEKNPSDFNYKEYLDGINVYGRVYGNRDNILLVKDSPKSLGFFVSFRNELSQRLARSGLTPQSQAFVEALLLGKREHLDPEITNSFRDAGVIHILALSGLHVGIILLILRFLTSWLHRFKYGQFIQSTVLVLLLWMFGFLTGLSPSIMRAVTMFSFVAVGMNINRNTSVMHSLALSAFVLLLINPKLLFHVGFQLSYVAVAAIVLIQPILASLWRPRSIVPKYLWNVFTVTLAAQIGVAPISLFYFHQFPGLFLLGNMILLPAMPLILGACLLFIVLLLIDAPLDWLAHVLNVVFEFFITVITWISEVKSFIITNIYLSFWELLCIYAILISLVVFFYKVVRKSRRERVTLVRPNYGLHAAIVFTICLLSIKSFNKTTQAEKLVVMHQNIGTAVSIIQDKQALLLTDLHVMDRKSIASSKERLLSSTLFRNKIVQHDSIKNNISWNDKTMLVVSKNGFYDASFKNATVLFSHAPQLNLERFITTTSPKIIIADGSNYKSSIAQWQETCKKYNVPFVNTYETGAFEVE